MQLGAPKVFLAALLSLAAVSNVVPAFAAATPQTIAHLHGTITKIDPKRGTFMIHHDPFPMMPMAMTMEVQPKNPGDLKKVHVGEVITVTVDTAIVPWPGTDIKAAK
jgi:Cu/Ag efflux protein CusF